MIASTLQVILYRIIYQRYEKMHLISLAIIFILGGATLFFHNPWFIKWKPTGIYWLSAIMFLASTPITKRPLIQHIMEANINLPARIWLRLNYAWSVFFIIMGAINLYVAYNYSTSVWVNFKLFGGIGCTLLFVFLQATYLTKHHQVKDVKENRNPKAADKMHY
jgi:intracellular septation protein